MATSTAAKNPAPISARGPEAPKAAIPPTMNAAWFPRYGPLDGLTLATRPTAERTGDQLLVRVHTAALHVGDCFSVRGRPFPVRFETGLLRPKVGIVGYDFAGEVVDPGPHTDELPVGTRVFGMSPGTCAEYVAVAPDHLTKTPPGLSTEHAATLATSGHAALAALRDVAGEHSRGRVLVNGAAGGVGSFAVQIAKQYGAEVTAVCSSRSAPLLRELGVDHIVDYTSEDFCEHTERYDLIFDNIENRSLADVRRALRPDGMLILNSGTGASGLRFLVRLLHPVLLSPFVRHTLRRYMSMPTRADLDELAAMAVAGTVRPLIADKYPLARVREALERIDQGHVHGKLLVRVAP